MNGCRGGTFLPPPLHTRWHAATAPRELRVVAGCMFLGCTQGPLILGGGRVLGGPKAASPVTGLAETFSLERKTWGSQFYSGSRRRSAGGEMPAGGAGVPGVGCGALTTRVEL